jgi:hypothetical protein
MSEKCGQLVIGVGGVLLETSSVTHAMSSPMSEGIRAVSAIRGWG